MKRLCLIVALTCTVVITSTAWGQDEKPVQLSLFNPAQIYPEDSSIKGVRLNLIYGRNVNMTGLDIGLANHATGDFQGLQWGLVGLVDGSGFGWQDNVVNIVNADFQGLQWGGFNKAGGGKGMQLGIVNLTDNFKGFQLGLFNMAEHYEGLQIGIINVINDKPSLPVLPIVNWQF